MPQPLPLSMHPLRARVDAVCATSPDADPVTVATLLLEDSELEQHLHTACAGLSPHARALVAAHGRWARWDPRAIALAAVSSEAAAIARVELRDAGWLEDDAFPLAVRGFARAHLPPTPAMSDRAAAAAEEAFHRTRYAGAADVAARADLEHCSRWSERPEVAQWAAIAREDDLGDAVCARCRPWAALEQCRAARWRGWYELSARRLDEAERTATDPRARFFVAFLRTVRAIQAGTSDGAARLDALTRQVSDDGEWFFVRRWSGHVPPPRAG